MAKLVVFRNFEMTSRNIIDVERGPMHPLILDAMSQLKPLYAQHYFPPYPWFNSFTQYILGRYDNNNNPAVVEWYRKNAKTITQDTHIPILASSHTFGTFNNTRLKPFLKMAITADEYETIKDWKVIFYRDMRGFCALNIPAHDDMTDDLARDIIYIVSECRDPEIKESHLFVCIPKIVPYLIRCCDTMSVDCLADERGSERYTRITSYIENGDKNHIYTNPDDYILIDLGPCDTKSSMAATYMNLKFNDPTTVITRVRNQAIKDSRCINPFYWPNPEI